MNTITIELCAEDRARLDAILKALENRPNCEGCVSSAIEMSKAAQAEIDAAKAEAKASTLTNNPPEPEKPEETPAEHPLDAAPIDVPEVDAGELRAEVQRKVVTLCAAGKKAEVKAIVTAYADKVSDIPNGKLAEALEKLNKLEG